MIILTEFDLTNCCEGTHFSVSYMICMHVGKFGICKYLKGAGTKSHLFIRWVSGFSRGALEGAGGAIASPYHPLCETLISIP